MRYKLVTWYGGDSLLREEFEADNHRGVVDLFYAWLRENHEVTNVTVRIWTE